MEITEARILSVAQLPVDTDPQGVIDQLVKDGESPDTAYLLVVAANMYLASQPKEKAPETTRETRSK